MDSSQKRNFLFMGMVLVLFMLGLKWQTFKFPPPEVSKPAVITEYAAVPQASGSSNTPLPSTADSANATVPAIQIRTDVMVLDVSLRGGDILNTGLLKYPTSLKEPDQPFFVLDSRNQRHFRAQNGLIANEGAAPNHNAIFQSAQQKYEMQAGENTLVVPLTWEDPSGITVTKTYTFTRGSYDIQLQQEVNNRSGKNWIGAAYAQLNQIPLPKKGGFGVANAYEGAVLSVPEDKYRKITFDAITKNALSVRSEGGWIAMIQHYFLAAWVPGSQQTQTDYYTISDNGRLIAGLKDATTVMVATDQNHTFSAHLYVGPKIQDVLKQVAPNLQLTVDYGWLTFIAEWMFLLLQKIHGVINNWGWSILVLTLIIKGLFFPLSERSYRSMAKMKNLAPEMERLKAAYGEDQQKYSQEVMSLYRKEKVNPLGGCWPMLVQIPVFISLYYVLLESVELRQASWIGWLHDLSAQDPYYVLPLLMGATMFIQQKLSPPPTDPTQAKIMLMMPVIFTTMFLWMPSGLVLYWTASNIMSIAQQWLINKRLVKTKK